MIPNLLWRCPICETNDALTQNKRLFRSMKLHCAECKTVWEVERVIGDDFQLQVLESPTHNTEIGVKLPLAQWYDRMKATVSLEPISDPDIQLEAGEHLYLTSRETTLIVNQEDPIRADLKDENPKISRYSQGIIVGVGRLFLTDQRLIWQGNEGLRYIFPLTRVNSAYIAGNHTLMVLYEIRILDLRFKGESLLKWLTYFGHVGKIMQETQGHPITTSNY
jgi:hypothetical protein